MVRSFAARRRIALAYLVQNLAYSIKLKQVAQKQSGERARESHAKICLIDARTTRAASRSPLARATR